MDKLALLKEWMKADRDVRSIVVAALVRSDEDVIDGLANNQPETFDALYATIEAMLEDVPTSVVRRA